MTAAGEIDISTVTGLRERLFGLVASGCPLVIDLDQVSFIDSAGLAALAARPDGPPARGRSLHAARDRPIIRELLCLTRLDCRIPLARTLAGA